MNQEKGIMTQQDYDQALAEGKCPVCGAELIYEGGCAHCPECAFSVCPND